MNLERIKKSIIQKKMSQAQYIAVGFLFIILLGAALLTLPICSARGTWTDPLTALFTATSASCVTGLIVADSYSNWSIWGQLVIITMIQIGGLGFVTIGVFFSIFTRRNITLNTRSRLMESVSALQLGGLLKLTKVIVKGTLLFELLGALILAIRFIPTFGLIKGIYYGLFHAISAFCNAGFDLMGCIEPYSSFSYFVDDPVITVTLCLLILIGGLGFLVWDDIYHNKLHIKKYRLHTKLVLLTNLILIVIPAILFCIFESSYTLEGANGMTAFCASLFDAVTPRTAGFNTTDTAMLSPASQILTWILMIIGGGSGSTAGGIKVTTIAVLLIFVISGLRQSDEVEVFDRRFEADIIKKASMVLMINLSLAIVASIIILGVQPQLAINDVVFETISAISTVGMTRGITRELSIVSKIVIMLLMYLGRVGSLTFAFSLFKKKDTKIVKSPVEHIVVG